jgi:UDP-N-acetylmuramoyl-tripeptide--D-alanyl-D-alanine ligase
MEISQIYHCWKMSKGIATDTRKLQSDQMFFALKGDNFDGNKFVNVALEMKASFVVTDDPTFAQSEDARIINVSNVLETLQDLARYHRDKLDIPVLGITGSNGKTTTKELTRDVLSKKYRVLATVGNLNNHIGVPLTVLSIDETIEFAIIEMGANHQNEIDMLCHIAKPNYCMITNIGKAHLDGFGGVEGIKKGKSELYRFVASTNGSIFINEEDKVLNELKPDFANLIIYRPSEILQLADDQEKLIYMCNEKQYSTHLYGTYNLSNIAFAIACGRYFGVEETSIHEAISSYIPGNNRSQILNYKGNRIILDAYNANPSSMKASIESFVKLGGDQVVVIGDMFELGEYSKEEHLHLMDLIETYSFTDVIYIGNIFYGLSSGRPGHFFKHTDEAKLYFDSQNYQDKTLLLKGSRGIAVERILV